VYKHDTTVHVRVVSSVARREGGHSDELEEVVLPLQAPKPGGSYPRPGHGRAVRAKQERVWEVGTVTGTRLSKIGGLLVFVGAVAFVLHVVLRSVLTAGVDPAVSAQAGLWVPVNALGALGAALVLLGLPAVYARMAGEGGLTGLVGFALVEVSWMFFGLFLSLYGALVLPWLADQTPRLVAVSAPTPLGFVVAFALGLLAWLVGAVLLAVPFVRGPARARWVGYVLPASALWVLVGNFVIAPGGPASNLAVNLLSNLGPVLLLIGLGYLGFRAWAERALAKHGEPGADVRVMDLEVSEKLEETGR
jgi:hypothetical protein